MQWLLIACAAVELEQDHPELGGAGEHDVARARAPLAVEAARQPPAALDLRRHRRSGQLPRGDEVVLAEFLADFDQSRGRVAERMGDRNLVAGEGVRAETEPAVVVLVFERELSVGKCRPCVGVVGNDARQPRQSGSGEGVVRPLHPQVVGFGPASVGILPRDHPVAGANGGVEVALVAGLLVGTGEATDHLPGVERNRWLALALIEALEAAIGLLYPGLPVRHPDSPLGQIIVAEELVEVPDGGNDVAGRLRVAASPAAETKVADAARSDAIL